MSGDANPKKKLTLYDKLLPTNGSATISAEPVMYKKDEQEKDKAKIGLAFQPRAATSRPQKSQKPKAKPNASKSTDWMSSSSPANNSKTTAEAQNSDTSKRGFEDWRDLEGDYPVPQWKNNKKKNKNKKLKTEVEVVDFNDYYTLDKPTNFETYKNSQYHYEMNAAWRNHLMEILEASQGVISSPSDDAVDISPAVPKSKSVTPTETSTPPKSVTPPPDVTPSAEGGPANVAYSATISAEPIHYNVPSLHPDVEMADGPADNDTGQDQANVNENGAPTAIAKPKKGRFAAAKMLAKMGYVKGQGLGANNDGITKALQVKQYKDSSGFGGQNTFAITNPGARADTRKKHEIPAQVMIVWGILDTVDLKRDSRRQDGGIKQDVGDAFKRYGTIERIDFHKGVEGGRAAVAVKFNDQASALNALQDLNKPSYRFQGRRVRGHYHELSDYDAGNYHFVDEQEAGNHE